MTYGAYETDLFTESVSRYYGEKGLFIRMHQTMEVRNGDSGKVHPEIAGRWGE